MHTALPREWLERLKIAPERVGRELITEAAQTVGHPRGEAVRNALAAGISGVFCLDNQPCAAVVVPSQNHDNTRLMDLYTDLWNQGELDFLLLLFPDRVEIYTLDVDPRRYGEPFDPSSTLSTTLPAALDVLRETGEIEAVITGLQSGRLLQKKQGGLDAESRVDAALVRDLEQVRKKILVAEGFEETTHPPGDLVEQVHGVLLQAMFLLYLEDRGIIEAGYIHLHGNKLVGTLHDLLRSYPSDFSGLLERLDRDLNGGLFKFSPTWKKHTGILADFMGGMRNFDSGQGRLLRIYRFEHIPVELLSEVYDRFLGSEGEKKKQGAYYTPRRLASLVVDQVWESLRKHLDAGRLPEILDPSCGSGIFPALLFQRIAAYLPNPSWEDLKKTAERLYGIDTNPTAVQISAFSLYLALLHRAHPKELRKLMSKGKVLPRLLGKTLVCGNFFEYPEQKRFDCIIGNPPWGAFQQEEDAEGNRWMHAENCPEPDKGERSWPFIWKSLKHLPPEGMLTMLLPSTGFFLNDVGKSLSGLLEKACLTRLTDLSALRFCLFAGADFPACIVSAARVQKGRPHTFDYFCPKADLNSTRGDRIILAESDRHLIHAHAFAADSVSATQRPAWFSPIERRLLAYLDTLPALRDLPLLETKEARKKFPGCKHPEWGMGLGFQEYKGKRKKTFIPGLSELPNINVRNLMPWVQCKDHTWECYTTEEVVWQNYFEGFTAPHIVIPRSIRNFRLRASYSECDFSFTTSATAITVPDSHLGRAAGKFLTAFLNSSFTAWFAAARGLAVNRPRFTPSILLSIPFPTPEVLPHPEKAGNIRADIVAKMDELMRQAQVRSSALLNTVGDFPSEEDIRELDALIFAYLDLRSEEIAAIRESLELVRNAAQPTRSGEMPALWEGSRPEHWKTYCNALSAALRTYMTGAGNADAEVLGYSRDLVIVQVTYRHNEGNGVPSRTQRQQPVPLQDLPENLLQSLEYPLGGNIYLQRCATVFAEDHIILIKPRQRRFWLTSTAYADADHILSNLLRQAESSEASA
jgi:hypothetical protein